MESENILGMFPLQTDYEDYRDVDGIKQPFQIRWSMPGRSWGRKIVEIKENVASMMHDSIHLHPRAQLLFGFSELR